ncbi:MAG: GNAT family N-acetyltransferase, partial [Clostridia bacterium]|nr:GNAT family N-acetyltransferase [Clostridia bacterium]
IPDVLTERLILTKLVKKYAFDMYEYASRDDVTRYLTWSPHPDIDYTRKFIRRIGRLYKKGRWRDWAIIEKASGRMIGTIGFTRLDAFNRVGEIGYCLNPDYCNRGFTTEAAAALVKFGFGTLRLNRIEGRCIDENIRSRRVMEKVGMKYDGTLREAMYIKGQYRNIVVMSMLAGDLNVN